MILSGDRSLSAQDLSARAAKAATGMERSGFSAGDAVALLLRNDFAFFEASNAAAMLGAFSVPINWHFGPEEVAHILSDSSAKLLVVHADLLPRIASAVPTSVEVLVVTTPPEVQNTGPSAIHGLKARSWDEWLAEYEPFADLGTPLLSTGIVYTSGTTGRPKGVQRTASKETAASTVRAVGKLFDLRPDARAAVTGPMYHSALNGYGLGMAAAGADLWLMPRFDAEELLAMIERHRLTHMHLVPIMFVRLLRLPEEVRRAYDVSSLRHVVHGAAPCPIEIKRRMIDWWGPVIYEYFGSTETRMIAASNSAEWLAHPGTIGRILPNTDVAIINEQGEPVPHGQPGEIFAWNHDVEDFAYTNDPAKREAVDRAGLVTAGDVGYVDDEGFLYLCDRRRDMINSGGVNIYPAEIEGCLLGLAGVQDSAVFGIPDDEYGESVAAVIQVRPTAVLSARYVQDFIRGRLAGYKTPKLVSFVSQLPRDDTGKILKRLLREPYWQGYGGKV